MKRSRSADYAAFRRAAEDLYLMVADPATGSLACEECGCYLPPGTVPHHRKGAGLGGRRLHTVENLSLLCVPCHNAKHF